MNSHTTELKSNGKFAILGTNNKEYVFDGQWIKGSPWERFGRYNSYIILRSDGAVARIQAHAGELVPGSTEDLVTFIKSNRHRMQTPASPLTLELDPTYACASTDCGGRCFSAPYRIKAPTACIPPSVCSDIVRAFAYAGGRIVRFDGGGDPLCYSEVCNGRLPLLARELGLKSTILTSGDLLPQTNLQAIVDARCYVRVSLNAATQAARESFHGNKVQLCDVCRSLEELASKISREQVELPIACSFLLDTSNLDQLVPSAVLAKSLGIAHFSVRRVLGPPSLRPDFSSSHLSCLPEIFSAVEEIASDNFQVFLPWREPNEPDLNPSRDEFLAVRCWQSTLKTVIEPDPDTGGIQGQLCGRYRGRGTGQEMQRPPLFQCTNGHDWVKHWRNTFKEDGVDRRVLLRQCVSCIDRGFIKILEDMMNFLDDKSLDFDIFHLKSIPSAND